MARDCILTGLHLIYRRDFVIKFMAIAYLTRSFSFLLVSALPPT